jgi:hypothetical protein
MDLFAGKRYPENAEVVDTREAQRDLVWGLEFMFEGLGFGV